MVQPFASESGTVRKIELEGSSIHLSTGTPTSTPPRSMESAEDSTVLRHQTGKAEVIGLSGKHHEILPCNEGGWVNVNDVYGHIFNDNSNRIVREAEHGNYLDVVLATRYRRCCQAMWYSKKMQNRARFQNAAVRISISA